MPTRVVCPSCQASFNAPDAMVGKPVKCGKCKASFRIPVPESPPEDEVATVDLVDDEAPARPERKKEPEAKPAAKPDAPTEPRKRRSAGPSPVMLASIIVGVLSVLLIAGLIAYLVIPRGSAAEPKEKPVAQKTPKEKDSTKSDGKDGEAKPVGKDGFVIDLPGDKDGGKTKTAPVEPQFAELNDEFPDPPVQNGLGLVADDNQTTMEGLPRGAVLKLSDAKTIIRSLQFLDDSRTLIWTGHDRHVRFLDIPDGKRQRLIKHQDRALHIKAIAPHGRVALAEEASKLSFISLRQGGFSEPVCPTPVQAEFSPSGDGIAVIPFLPNQVWFYSVKAPSDPPAQVELTSPVQLLFSPTGTTLAVGLRTGPRLEPSETVLVDLSTKKEARRVAGRPMAFSRSGNLMTVDSGGSVHVVPAQPDQPLKRLLLPVSGYLRAMAWSPDERRLACAKGSEITLFDDSGENELAKLTGHNGLVSLLVFSPDGRWLVSADANREIIVWDLASVTK